MKANNEVVIRTREQWESYCAQWDDHNWREDPRRLANKKFQRRKSRSQEDKYRGMVRELANHIGELDANDLHRDLIQMFGIEEEVQNFLSGDYYTQFKSTADYSVDEMSMLIEKLIVFAATFYEYRFSVDTGSD